MCVEVLKMYPFQRTHLVIKQAQIAESSANAHPYLVYIFWLKCIRINDTFKYPLKDWLNFVYFIYFILNMTSHCIATLIIDNKSVSNTSGPCSLHMPIFC